MQVFQVVLVMKMELTQICPSLEGQILINLSLSRGIDL